MSYVHAGYRIITTEKSIEEKPFVDYLKGGINDLETFSADAHYPLVYFTQLEELRHDICCPETFQTPILKPFSERYVQLKKAKELVATISVHDYKILQQRLIEGADFDRTKESMDQPLIVDELYILITKLGSNLAQGELMTTKFLSSQGEVSTHLFQAGWKQAASS